MKYKFNLEIREKNMSYYNDEAEKSYQQYQKEHKKMNDFYESFSTKEKEMIRGFYSEDLSIILKKMKNNKRNLFNMAINSDGSFFIEQAFSLLLFALRTQENKKIKFYEDFLKICLKKTNYKSIEKKYLTFSIDDMFLTVLNIASHTKNTTPFFNLFNHFSDLFLKNESRVNYIFDNYSSTIFENKEIYNFLKDAKYSNLFYPHNKDKFEGILESLLQNEQFYNEEEIYNFLKESINQPLDFIDECFDFESGPVSIILEHIEDTNSNKILNVLKMIILSNDELLINSNEEQHPIVRSLKENLLLNKILNENTPDSEPLKINRRL